MQKKINKIKIEVLIVTLIQLIFVGIFLSLYLFNAFNIDDYVLPEHIAYTCCIIAIADCFFVWTIMFRIFKLRQKSDIRTSDIVGNDIQEAYLFGKLGFAVVDEEGTVLWVSDLFIQRSINLINQSIYEWCPKLKDFIEKETGDTMTVTVGNYDYSVKFLRTAGLFIFKDTSEYESLRKYNEDQATCVGIINIDNYNDITQIGEGSDDTITHVKNYISDWAKDYEILLRSIRSDSYFAVCNFNSLKKMENDNFSILDKIRKMNVREDTRPTLSIGFAHGFPDVNKLNEMASNAIEIAMSRGGDQAVVSQYGSELKFYGGKTEAVENRSKVKVRVFANSLISLIKRSSNIVIMGHLDMDMDALGSCLGVKAICEYCKKPSVIVYDGKLTERKTKSALITTFSPDELSKMVVSPKEAPDKIKPTSLVIVCDVSRPKMTMCPKILEITDKVVVIDHHRRAEDFIEKPVLSQIETSASSASELVAEIIRYNSENNQINLDERYATIMLSGIFLDTGFYKSKTVGLRTFEASMILKEFGADNGKADDFLKDEYEEYVLVNKLVDTMRTPFYGVCYCRGDENDYYERSTLAKAANQCMQLKGVNACFVIAKTAENETRISARSDGTVNVQILCEKFGGGGHFAMAAALFKDTTIKKAEEILLDTLNSNLSDARNESAKKGE